jgi:hypothetical protein
MTRKTFLTIVSPIALAIGALAVIAPGTLVEGVKHAAPSEAANVMARTVGVLLVSFGLLNFLVRGHGDSPTMRAILAANLLLQLGLLPIDPLAYAHGVYAGLGSCVPNTVLHVLLASGFGYHLLTTRPSRSGATA